MALGLAGALAIASVLLFVSRVDMISAEGALYSLGTIWVGSLFSIHYLYRAPPRNLPFMPLVGLFYAVAFGLPPFLIPLAWEEGATVYFWVTNFADNGSTTPITKMFGFDREPLSAFRLILLGVVVFALAFVLVRAKALSWLPALSIPGGDKRGAVIVLAWLLLVSHFAYRLVPAIETLPSIGQFLVPASYVAFGIFLLLWMQRKISATHAAVALLLVFADAALLANDRVLAPIILLAIFLGALLFRIRPVTGFFIAVAFTIPLLAAHSFWTGNRVAVLSFLMGAENVRFIDPGASPYPEYRLKNPHIHHLITRISLTWPFAYVVQRTPDEVPYWQGETYKPLLGALVPRMLWPEKPEERTGYKFGLRYELIAERMTRMSFNLPWITELYANFGAWGIVLGMAAFGVLFAFLDRLFNEPEMSDLERVCGFAIIFPLFYQGSNFSVMTGSVPLFAIALYLYFRIGLRILGGRRGKQPAGNP